MQEVDDVSDAAEGMVPADYVDDPEDDEPDEPVFTDPEDQYPEDDPNDRMVDEP